ncbi:MAG: type I DNA topoisomerase [Oscillospiraceae bacterium]|nr:type I DNA topoisomerase [Oscillospiraceae bacterium]
MKLIIVEAPAKARTISAYLGDAYTVRATVGHIRDLPKKGKGLDVEAGFALDYQVIEGKEDVIRELKKLAKQADGVLLATDPDREGEAISWHLKELLGLSDEQARRVTFNEITQKEVRRSIAAPRKINYNLVDAQQARRALDRLVGYEISPVLWRRIRKGLSAGRVQSVAARIVVDREEEIRAFAPQEYWTIEVALTRENGEGGFTAHYFAPLGEKKAELKSESEAMAVVNAVKGKPFAVHSVSTADKKRSPAPPFTTSTLQQEASRKLGYQPRRAMAVAQQLYEGVQIEGHGLTGLITYMRTDSLRLSGDAVSGARDYITREYGPEYLPPAPRAYKNKAAAQDAHEAIRPSYVELPPKAVRGSLTEEQYRLYKLIWDRFIACQMENAVLTTLTIDAEAAGHIFRANHTQVKFPGFIAVYEEGRDEEDVIEAALPNLSEGEALRQSGIEPLQHFTKPPARYTEASLIRALEEQGIGRPSTYAPTVSTILDREYVVREQKHLKPTPLGETVTGYMREKFGNIVDLDFTAAMETDLDLVEEGKLPWKDMLQAFYGGFALDVQRAMEDVTRVRVPDEATNETCEACGRPMVVKLGRFGRYMACEGYPNECRTTRPLSEPTDGFCPLCGGTIRKKKSKRGFSFFGCDKYPECTFMTWDTPQKTQCPECGKTQFKPRYAKQAICENPACSVFVPEDARGYKKKAESSGEDGGGGKTAVKKAAPSKTGAKSAAKKPAASKAGAEKPAARKPAASKPASRTKKT